MEIFTCAFVSYVIVSPLHMRTLPQGPRVSSKTVFSYLSFHRFAPIYTAYSSHTTRASKARRRRASSGKRSAAQES